MRIIVFCSAKLHQGYMNSRWCRCVHLFIILAAISAAGSASFSSKENNEQDRISLLALRKQFIAGGTSLDDSTVLNSWNASTHFCQWQGITCGKRHKRVIAMQLVQQNLKGVVSPSVGNLTFLRTLYLMNNSLRGEIPKEIGKLRRLQYLDLSRNSFQGRIPIELSNCSNLIWLRLYVNNLTGRIPFQFGSLLKISTFYVFQNNLAGEMPSFLRNLSSLSQLHLGNNYFHGGIQHSLQGLSKLTLLSLPSNDFSGTISSLYNLSSLQYLDIATNHFTGIMAQDMDIAFPRLTFLSFPNNNFTGTIPSSLFNISGLYVIQLGGNKLTGHVPNKFGKLKSLWMLQLSDNQLGSKHSDDWNFIDSLTNCTALKWLILAKNMFGGQLPDTIANFSYNLQVLEMRENYITGYIPEGIGELSGLTFVDFGKNLLTGTIPASIGKLTNVSTLHLYENNLHGGMPSSIGNLTNLSNLDLSTNSMDGIIPAAIGNCTSMQVINISRNHFTGNLPNDVFTQFRDLRSCNVSYNSFDGMFPSAFGKLRAFSTLDASYNNFSGEIQAQLGESLEFLSIAGNSFNGSIPPSLGNLRGLQWLDLSNNNLSGAIPSDLAYIAGLQNLNLSFNQLEGEVPLFKNLTRVSVVGNDKLCSGNRDLQLQPCKHRRKGKLSIQIITIISLSVLTSCILFVLLFIFRRRRKHKKDNTDDLPEGYWRVTYVELFKATDGFAKSNLIGKGSFGDVYRGILDGDERKPVAVKVLNLSNPGAKKSFKAECRVLRKIRHRNLLGIITSCSSLDLKGNDFKALVFDFMSNGNLDNWLHFGDKEQLEARAPLTLAKRFEIAIDVGYALDYLHNSCETPIVHCDLKPSNILLDDDMVAHVGDFGLAKLIHGVTENHSGGESLSAAIKGSIGYVAPEYGMGASISVQGDIYSYGILLLELITGKRPTDDMFNNEMSLRSFIERAIPDHVEEIVDECLVNELHEATATQRNPEETKLQWHTYLISFLEVGISCSAESPRDRMDIQSAIRCLKGIKSKYDLIARLQIMQTL